MTSSVVAEGNLIAQGYGRCSIAFKRNLRTAPTVCLPSSCFELRVLLSTLKFNAMAVENQTTNPLIIEPAVSSNPGTPSRLLIPSFNTSSSSTFFDSSRPQSRGSSATSPTEPPSPCPKDVEPYRLTNIRPPAAQDADLLPPTRPYFQNERTRNMTTSSTTQPSQRAEGSSHSNGSAWVPSCCPLFFNRRWLEHSLGVFGLVASLVGLLFIGVRTYKLAVITTENSTLDGCTSLIQVSDVHHSLGTV